jgi:hypothetical protein
MRKTITIECSSCKGTGLYVGMSERDGAAVVCHTCKGIGATTFSYNDFTGRKIRDDVERVFSGSMGYVITAHDITAKSGEFMPFSKAGVSYEEWLNGEKPRPIKFLGCPMMANQGACHQIKGFTDECNKKNGGWLSYIPDCKNKCNSEECWAKFEKEHAND